MVKHLPQPLFVDESPRWKEYFEGFSKVMWIETDFTHVGGMILSTPWRLQRPPSEFGFFSHFTQSPSMGNASFLPLVRSTQKALFGRHDITVIKCRSLSNRNNGHLYIRLLHILLVQTYFQ